MARQVEIRVPRTSIDEYSCFTATVVCKDRSTQADDIPTTMEYRVFNRTTRQIIKDWTTVTPAASVEIEVSAQDNVVKLGVRPYETMELVISTDRDLATEATQVRPYRINTTKGRR